VSAVSPRAHFGAMQQVRIVMPGFMPGTHVLTGRGKKDVDGRDKPGHDECRGKCDALLI
jgi:hypothetical protein